MSSSSNFPAIATPTRDRDRDRLPFPQSANPSPGPSIRQTAASSASTSFTHLPSTSQPSPSLTASQHPISVDTLLKQHASASDPKAAALDQIVGDRNLLSAQNTQLWKLIEKQRAGYNQILKELERIRGERDHYKTKLAVLSGSTGAVVDKRQKTTERGTRPSLDVPPSSTNDHNPRQSMRRNHSDDAPPPRNQPQLHSSRSQEPLSPPTHQNSLPPPRSNSPPPPPPPASAPTTLQSPASSTRNSSRPFPAPLVVPPRAENLPVPQSAVSASSESSSSFSMHNSTNGEYQSSVRSAFYARKSSIAESTSSVMTAGSSFSASSASTATSSGQNHPTPSQHHFSAADQSGNPRQRAHSSLTTPVADSFQFPPHPAAPSPATTTPSSSQPQPSGLLTIAESKPHVISRDSRISLPDEARHYIANMVDSPVPSPNVDGFAPKPKISSVLGTPGNVTKSPRESEFLDLDEEDDDDEEEDELEGETDNSGKDSPIMGDAFPHYPRGALESKESKGVEPPDVQPSPAEQPYTQEDTNKKKEKPRAAAEDFPLPPPTSIFMQRQPMGSQEALQSSQSQQNSQPQAKAQFSSPSKLSPEYQPPPGYSPVDNYPSNIHSMRTDQQSLSSLDNPPTASFRALPLLSSDLPHTTISVSHSFVRPNDRGKEVLSFVVSVNPGNGKDGWKVEKMYSDVLGLDQRVRNNVGKGIGKKIGNLPEGKLWKDHAPAKVDQRKAVLENYLQTLINLPIKNNDEVIAFFTSDIVREEKQPVMQAGHKEGYLTKRGKNFGGWKTRYFVLSGPILEYYDCRGGAHLGSITITGAQIGRQQRTERIPTTDEEKEYRHAFLIVEAKKGPGGNHPRHVLCAESDEDRDSWVEMLVRYFSGSYSEDPVNYGSGLGIPTAQQMGQPRSSTSSTDVLISTPSRRPQLSQDPNNAKLFQPAPAPLNVDNYTRSSSPSKSIDPSPVDRYASSDSQNFKRATDRVQGLPSSLPDSSPLSAAHALQLETSSVGQRANSELGHYPDMKGRNQRQPSPEQHRIRDPQDGRKSFYPTLNTVVGSPSASGSSERERVPSPEKLDVNGKVKISGPLNGVPIPSGFKFGGKDVPSAEATAASNERREKAKSRSFWGFGKANGDKSQAVVHIPRAVFGVPLEEALDVAQICNLPAIVFRSIQYLEAKKADQEEGIYRLSGSSAVIKSLKDRFNTEGDIDLLASDEYWDPHAIAGLLKSFLRELPASILTRDLHLRFLSVIDFVDAQERIKELSHLIAALPITNYSLLRALTAHLILIVQNSSVNKMTMRNVGIVFSPTLGIPAGVFSLMLGEFNRVFNVDNDLANAEGETGEEDELSEPFRRNSRRYSEAAADQLLGLSGRTLNTSTDETQSDGDDFSVNEESGTDTVDEDLTLESSNSGSPVTGFPYEPSVRVTPPDTPMASKTSKASSAAASRGLNVTVAHSERGNRHSKLIGLPSSPRPPHSPSRTEIASETT